ncbi:hypothetical protein IFM89_004598, partial [Coptis chinensis]
MLCILISLGDPEYHQQTLANLKLAVKSTKKLCAVMLDTVGPELQVVNVTEDAISLVADGSEEGRYHDFMKVQCPISVKGIVLFGGLAHLHWI